MSAAPDPLAALPPLLRARTAALAARALGELPVDAVPASLRRAAEFVPSRRARLAGRQIAALVESDTKFRDALAVQVQALAPTALAGREDGTPASTDDLLETAAVAFLVRPAGWEDMVSAGSAAAVRLSGDADSDAHSRIRATEQRLTEALSNAKAETAAVRERLGRQLEKLKTENAQLRRTVGATRSELKRAESASASAAAATESARRDAANSARSSEAETRRLRSRVSDLEAQLAQLGRTERTSRDAEATRQRLLLDTVIEAATGLRRELALPTVELLPADTVDAVLPTDPAAAHLAGRGVLTDGRDQLRRMLDLPRLHLLVDGYNVTKTAWPEAPLDQQRARLISAVAGLIAGKRIETTLVFDGANASDAPVLRAPKSIRVRFSPPGVIADDLLRQLVASEPQGRPVVMVTSDRELASSVEAPGVRCLSAAALIDALKR
jgi:predicted RNA-binding protein with PIN domain